MSAVTPFTITVQPSAPTTPSSQTVCRSSRVVLSAPTYGAVRRCECVTSGTKTARVLPFKLTEIASPSNGARPPAASPWSACRLRPRYYVKVFAANNNFIVEGPFVVTVNYGCTAPGARQAALDGATPAEGAETSLQIRLLPNPLTDGRLRAVVQGAQGQPLTLELLDLRGRKLHQQQWETAAPAQAVDWDVSQSARGGLPDPGGEPTGQRGQPTPDPESP